MSLAENADVKNIADYRKDKKNYLPYVYGTIILSSLLTIGSLTYYWFVFSETHIATDNAYIEKDLSPVNSRIMGFVSKTFVEENESVKNGDLLAEFDDKDLQVEYGYKKAKLDKATADMKRAEMLKKSKVISDVDYENSKANLAAQNADFEGTMLKMEFTHIKAPVAGIIAKKTIQPGQFIQPGQSLFIIVPDNSIWIRANYKETQIDKIKPGMKVEIEVDAFPSKKFYGVIESISPSSGAKLSLLPPENATGNFTKIVQRIPVRIKIDQKLAPYLKAGMSVTTTVLAR